MWIVIYEHFNGHIVCSLYEDEAEAEHEVQRLRKERNVTKAWKVLEQVFYKREEEEE